MLLSSNESGRVRHPLIGVATLHCAVTCTRGCLMRLSALLLPALVLLAGCGNGDSIGQGRLIGCYAAPGPHSRESVKLTRVDGRYFIAYRLASPWRQVDTPLITPDDEQLLRDGIARLSAESRYLRFFSPARELPPAVIERLVADIVHQRVGHAQGRHKIMNAVILGKASAHGRVLLPG